LVLVILVILTTLISKISKTKNKTNQLIPVPTSYEENMNKQKTNTNLKISPPNSSFPINNNIPATSSLKARFTKKKKILSKKEKERLERFKKTFPYDTNDFKITYSNYLGKFIVYTKTDQGKAKFLEWISQKDKVSQDFFKSHVIISKNKQEQVEKDYSNAINKVAEGQAKKNEINIPSPTPVSYEEIQKKTLKKFILSIFRIANNPPREQVNNSQPINKPYQNRPTTIATRKNIDLYDLFSEVGKNVGVPIAVLEGVMHIEYPSTFAMSPKQIAKYSAPGEIIPGCSPNVCSATGPMQITIGIDGSGSPNCASCCWKGKCLDKKGGCPNQWSVYGSAINVYGGYTHTPNPGNIKDNVYAAALKLKKDSQTNYPNNWQKEDVYRAAKSYYGNCAVKYQRLGNRTYCEYIWWYYIHH